MVYRWKVGYGITGIDAQVAGDVCNELEQQGKLDAQNLVDVSKPEDAPLHNAFEWRDDVAAEEYRKHQARNIINKLVIVPEEVEHHEPVRAFFTIASTEGKYVGTPTIIKTESMRDELLKQAKTELAAFARKYNQLEELAGVMYEIRKVV